MEATEPDTLQRRYLKVALRVRCATCGQTVQVPSPMQRLPCDTCGQPLSVPSGLWRTLLEQAEGHYPDLAWDFGHERSGPVEGIECEYVYGRKWPRCAQCDGRLPDEIVNAVRPLSAPCLACGAPVRGGPAPDWLVAAVPTVAYAIEPGGACFFVRLEGESARMRELAVQAEASRAATEAARRHPPCPSCQAPLPAPGARCPGCGQSQRRPTRTWLWALVALAVLVPAGLVAWRIHRRWDLITHSVSRYADHLADRPRTTSGRATQTSVAAQRSLRWRLRGVEHRGLPAAAVDPCLLSAVATRPPGRSVEMLIAIRCGGKLVFEGRADKTGRGLACGLEERPTITAAHYEYDVRCTPANAATAGSKPKRPAQPPQARVAAAGEAAGEPEDKPTDGDTPRPPGLYFDTATRQLSLRTARGAELRARIVREDGTGAGPALFVDSGAGATFEPVRIPVSRIAYEGQAGLPANTRCEVRVGPTGQADLPCRVRIQCGERVLYGGFGAGFCTCHVDRGQLRSARDDEGSAVDGDPKLRLSLAQGLARVEDDDPSYRVDLTWQATPLSDPTP